MKTTISALLFFALIAMIVSCSDSSTGNDDGAENFDPTLYGWAVGDQTDGYGTIVHTTDGGDTWIRQGDSLSIPNVSLHQVRAIDTLNVWVVGGNADGHAVILKTTDGGTSWTNLGASRALPDVELSAVSPLDYSTLWVAGSEGTILVSNDGGETWNDRSDPDYSMCILSDIVAVDYDNIWICGATASGDGMILHSTNGGSSWVCESDTTMVSEDYLISMSVLNADVAWIAGHATSLRTIDGGTTWERKCPFGEVIFDVNGVVVVDENTVWIVSDYGNINKTTDNGENWTSQVSDASGYYMLRICAFNENDAWICGMEQFPPCTGIMLHTTDGGTNWNQVSYGTEGGLWDIHFIGANN